MRSKKTVVFTPKSSIASPGLMSRSMIVDLFASRELAWQLALRDIRVQYRQAALGLLWAIFLPLANALSWLFLNSSGIVKIDTTGMPYAVYVLSGATIWAIFVDAVNSPLQQILAARNMLAKINFPREALIISGIYQILFNGLIKISILLSVCCFLDIFPTYKFIYFGIIVLVMLIMGIVFGLLIAPLGVLYTDVGRSLPLILQFLMYLSPVVYPMPEGGLVSSIIRINPATPFIVNARNMFVSGNIEFFPQLILYTILTFVLLILVWVIYRAAMPILIERIGA